MANIDQAREAYEAFRAGDMERLAEGFAEDAVWLSSDELPLGGLTEGRDQILANFAQLPDYWSEFDVDPARFLDCGDVVVVTGTQRATGEQGSFESPFVHVMEYRDGKLVRGEFHADSAKALKALGTMSTT
jgi:ketosteroid isomerase-like protein